MRKGWTGLPTGEDLRGQEWGSQGLWSQPYRESNLPGLRSKFPFWDQDWVESQQEDCGKKVPEPRGGGENELGDPGLSFSPFL
jgi:hypothetical protein